MEFIGCAKACRLDGETNITDSYYRENN